MQSPDLTFRQELFVFEYLKDQNASAAAGRAGYTASNLAAQGSELMSNPAIRDRIRLELADLLAEVRCSMLDLVKQRARIAFFNVKKMAAKGWGLLPLEEMDEDTRLVLEMRTVLRKRGPVTCIRHPDRQKSLRALERVHERLERLNEQYYAKLEKAGALRGLEEIEAMDREGAGVVVPEPKPEPAADFLKKDQEMSGWVAPPTIAAAKNDEKDKVLSGSRAEAVKTGAMANAKKPQEMSGSGGASKPRLSPLMAAMLAGLGGVAPAQNGEKHPVMSGSGRVEREGLVGAFA